MSEASRGTDGLKPRVFDIHPEENFLIDEIKEVLSHLFVSYKLQSEILFLLIMGHQTQQIFISR
jgi:hypothetical protein